MHLAPDGGIRSFTESLFARLEGADGGASTGLVRLLPETLAARTRLVKRQVGFLLGMQGDVRMLGTSSDRHRCERDEKVSS